MKILVFLIFLSVGLNAQSGFLFLDNSVIETDKQAHLAGSFGVGLASYVFFDTKEWTNELESSIYSLALVSGIGFLKENADRKTTGWDWEDIKFNTIGAVIGIATAYFLRRNAKKHETREQKELKQLKKLYE